MGKRSREKEELEFLAWKVKKLEKKRRRKHRHRDRSRSPPRSNNSDSATPTMEADRSEVPEQREIELEELSTTNVNNISAHEPTSVDVDEAATVMADPVVADPIEVDPAATEKTTDNTSVKEPLSVEADEAANSAILELLGEDPSNEKEYANDIQSDLAVRFEHIATSGLTKEIRKELYERYLPPGNCTLIDAPGLNDEIKAAVSETVLKRDKGIEIKQKQLCHAIAGLGEAITLLLAKADKDSSIIKILMDTGRLLCDCQYADSTTRRNFVLFNLKKEMKDQLQKTKIDKLLFGSQLQETLKTAKFISRTSVDLKQAKPPQPNRMKPSVMAAPTQAVQRNLNWKAPPPNRRPKGIQRPKEPAQKTQRGNFSRPSYRPPQTSRNRY